MGYDSLLHEQQCPEETLGSSALLNRRHGKAFRVAITPTYQLHRESKSLLVTDFWYEVAAVVGAVQRLTVPRSSE
jgi:hypothetical protein